jgi:gliding motility-associated-like protein
MKKHILYLILLLAANSTQAQLLNNGAQITLTNGALVSISNGLEHKAGLILNNGEIHLSGDWLNSSVNEGFDRSSTGLVEFNTPNAQLNGGGSTAFPNLKFVGNKSYYINTNIEAWQSLDIDDVELTLGNTNVIKLSNADETSLIRRSGIINTQDVQAAFVRNMRNTADYLFPMGSKQQNLQRFVSIRPSKTGSNLVSVSLQERDPSQDGFSRLTKQLPLDEINAKYYHIISQLAGNTAVNINFYSNKAEGFNALANWTNGTGWANANSVALNDAPNAFNTDREFALSNVNLPLGTSIPFSFGVKKINQQLAFFNAFSPDGDGKNDTWEIQNIDNYPDNDLKIYDRSGALVFSINGYNSSKFWDGQTVGAGSYVYVLRANIGGVNRYFKGVITLVKN